MPPPSERLAVPRFDGEYIDDEAGTAVRFFRDQRVEIGGDPGTWLVESGELRITSQGWDCEGVLGLDCLYLLASPGGDHRVRGEWICDFNAGRR